MNSFKQYSEEKFAIYLDNLGLYWDYEREWGGNKPDFTIYSDKSKSKIIAIVEVEDIEHTRDEKEILKRTKFLSRTTNPHTREREKINTGRKQLRFAKNYPCFLIIHDTTAPPKPPILTLGSMLGDLSISFPIWQDKKKPKGKSYNFFGQKGKMIDQKNSRPQNTTITAVGYLETINPDVIRSGFREGIQKIIKEIGGLQTKSQTNLYLKKTDALEKKLTKQGFDFDKKAVSVSYTINPFARKKFPKNFFAKPYSQINRYSLSSGRISVVYDWSKN